MIYLTPYDPTTRRCTGPSTDSGFASLAQVIELMGPPMRAGHRLHTYPGGVCFSDFRLQIDDAAVIIPASAQPPSDPHGV